MIFSELKRKVATRTPHSRGVVSEVIDEMMSVIAEALIDSDEVQLGSFGRLRLQHTVPASGPGGESKTYGGLRFIPSQATSDLLLRANLDMQEKEEEDKSGESL